LSETLIKITQIKCNASRFILEFTFGLMHATNNE